MSMLRLNSACRCVLHPEALRSVPTPFTCRSSLHLAAGDLGGTLRLLSYLPSHPEGWKGQRLVAWCACTAGRCVFALAAACVLPQTCTAIPTLLLGMPLHHNNHSNPSAPSSRLRCRGVFHLGDPATAMQRLRMHAAGPEDRTARQAVLLSMAAGALQLAAPLALPAAAQIEVPAALAALRALQRELALLLPQAAGLNPAAFRCVWWGQEGAIANLS